MVTEHAVDMTTEKIGSWKGTCSKWYHYVDLPAHCEYDLLLLHNFGNCLKYSVNFLTVEDQIDEKKILVDKDEMFLQESNGDENVNNENIVVDESDNVSPGKR